MRPYFLGFCLVLVGCSTAADRDSARAAWSSCIDQAIQRLDDGRTDPVSMATGIAPHCAMQYQRLTDRMVGANITARGQADMRLMMREEEIKLVTAAVVSSRSHRASR